MRILAITNLYPNPLQPHRGTFNRQQFRALAESHDVRVIAPIAWTDERAARKAFGSELPKDRRVACDGLVVDHPKYWFTPRVLRSCYGHFFRRSIERTFERALIEFSPELILSAWAYPDGWAAVELGRRAGLPVVVKVHGSDILTLANVPGRGKRTAEAMRNADGIVAVSRDLADKVVRMGADPGRVKVVYDGIDPGRFCPGSRSGARQCIGVQGDERIILFVGNLVLVKGVDVLVDACAELARRGERVRCFIVGQGPLRGALEQQAARLGVGDRVTFVGPVLHAELPDWFRAADVFVLPSHSEGVPCVLLEAAACRTPFVASRVGGIPEIAGLNRGEMVDPGDAGALAAGIARVLTATAATAEGESPKAFSRSHADAAGEIGAFCERLLNDHVRQRRIPPQPITAYVAQPKAS
jgi:glycosyltransferase involved in cell wall biosynthesis